MKRVFGQALMHKAHEAGDASCRTAYWWTNMFTPEYYNSYVQEFNRPLEFTFAEIVRQETKGALVAQTVTQQYPQTKLNGLNRVGQPMRYAPKFVSRVDTFT